MDIEGKRFLVIGGAGLIGSHIVEALLAEPVKEVIVYDNFCRGTIGNLENALLDSRCKVFDIGGDILQADILNEAMNGIDGVFHLAALWLLQCHEFPESAFETNVRGTFNVLEACKCHGIQRLIYSSSASVYGDALAEPMTEDHPYNNWTFYGATKIAGEQMFKAYHKRYFLKGVGLRYMNVYGPRQDHKGAYIAVMMRMLDNAAKGLPLVINGDGNQSYDFIYVDDVASANIQAMKSEVPFRFYNVGTGIKTSISELAKLILEATGSRSSISYALGEQPFVTNRVGDTRKAEMDLGFKAQIGLNEGLERLVRWYEDAGQTPTVR